MLGLFRKNKIDGEWRTVADLKVGMQIAVPKDGILDAHKAGRIEERDFGSTPRQFRNGDVQDGDVLWDEIVSIEHVGTEQVWDIEVEGTHNFVGNNIFAHNTYLTGNLGVATSTPFAQVGIGGSAVGTTLLGLDALSGQTAPIVDIKLASTSKFVVDASGNVGIGTTSPYAKLSVVGEVVAASFTATSTTATSTFAGGVAISSGDVFATARGSLAVGYNTGATNSVVIASGLGSTASGLVTGGSGGYGRIISSGQGSFVAGMASGFAGVGGLLTASNNGSIALGYANNSSITSSGLGSFAGGYTGNANENVTSSGSGSFAWGTNISATNGLSVAIGSGFTNSTANTFQVGYSASPTLTVNATKVGIGTTSPYAKLSVVGQTVSEYFTATSTTLASIFPNASTTNLTVAGLFFDSLNSAGLNGYVFQSTGLAAKWVATSTLGITAGSSSLFTDAGTFTYLTATSDDVVFGAATTANAPFWWDVSATTTYIGNGGAGDSVIQLGDDNNAWTLGYDDTDKAFRIASSTTLGSSDVFTILKTGGMVGIGTTTPWRTLSVSGTMALSSSLSVATVGNYLCINQTTYEVTSGTTCSASSRRFKDNIIPISYGLDTVMRLNPVSFTYKPEVDPNGDTRLGFIAEEVQVLLPELVALDKNGLPESVDYSKLVSVLTKAIQELNLKVDTFTTGTTTTSLAGGNTFMTNIWNFVSGELSSLGVLVSDGMVSMKALAVETLKVGSKEKPSGITLYDEDTGNPYCLKIKNGTTQTTAGECGTATTPTIAVQQSINTNTTTVTTATNSTPVTISPVVTTIATTTSTSTPTIVITTDATTTPIVTIPVVATTTTVTTTTTPPADNGGQITTSSPTPEPTPTPTPEPDPIVVTTSTETLTTTP